MKLIDAKEQLVKLNLPAFTLQDVMGSLQLEKTQASRIMNKLTKVGSLIKIKRGIWAWPRSDPLSLTPFLTSPFPCYLSLQSALFYHGIIDQIPGYYYVISLGPKRIERTSFGVFSIHHMHHTFFTGFETHYEPYYQIAVPEKAFLDYLYMSRITPSIFGKLPEIDSSKLSIKKMIQLIALITHSGMKTYLNEKLRSLFPSH